MTTHHHGLTGSDAVALAQKLAATSLDADFDSLEVDDDETTTQPLSYKDLYLNPTIENLALLTKQLDDRIEDGRGETILELGVEEDGKSMNLTEQEFATCLKTLEKAADPLKVDVTVIFSGPLEASKSGNSKAGASTSTTTTDNDTRSSTTTETESKPSVGHLLLRRRAGNVEDLMELRICVVGNVDAGKSTLIGVLTKDVLDDGRGKARINLFRNKHEIESGRTSSVGLEILGFGSKGETITPAQLGKSKLNWDDICHVAPKLLSFIDLAGHEKYLKTTVFGMTGGNPDFAMLMIGSNSGIIGMTKEHLGLALALNVPVFIVITKIDMCPANVLENTISQLVKILKSAGCRKIPMFMHSASDVLVTAGNFVSERLCPIFQVSSVDGSGLDLLKLFLNVLRATTTKYDSNQPVEFQITDTFSVPGVGTVVSGTVMSGIVHVGDSLLLGPDSIGHFTPTLIKSIQRKRVTVPLATAGHAAAFALKKIKRASLRKGMVLLSKSIDAKAYYEFEAEILVLYHSTTISQKYQAMVHCGCVRQTARIVGLDKQVLRTGDRAFVRFRFIQHPEYLKMGDRLLFREGRTKGVGKVSRLFSESEALAPHQTHISTSTPTTTGGQGGTSLKKHHSHHQYHHHHHSHNPRLPSSSGGVSAG